MTEKEIISHFQIRIMDFDGDLMPDELGFYEKETNTAFLSSKLNKNERVKVLLHELGHKDHTRSEYQNARLRCENEADRNMIHHLVRRTRKLRRSQQSLITSNSCLTTI